MEGIRRGEGRLLRRHRRARRGGRALHGDGGRGSAGRLRRLWPGHGSLLRHRRRRRGRALRRIIPAGLRGRGGLLRGLIGLVGLIGRRLRRGRGGLVIPARRGADRAEDDLQLVLHRFGQPVLVIRADGGEDPGDPAGEPADDEADDFIRPLLVAEADVEEVGAGHEVYLDALAAADDGVQAAGIPADLQAGPSAHGIGTHGVAFELEGAAETADHILQIKVLGQGKGDRTGHKVSLHFSGG